MEKCAVLNMQIFSILKFKCVALNQQKLMELGHYLSVMTITYDVFGGCISVYYRDPNNTFTCALLNILYL